jgi:hypothetical protein
MKITNKKSLFTIVALVTIFLFAPLVTKTQNIPVPFTTQAPYSNWNQPWQDFCEEAVILMIDSYYTGGKLDKPTASKELLQINKIKENHLGKSLDEDANKIISLVNNFLSWETKLVKNPTLEQIKKEIDMGRPIIAPVHGRYLYNPYFRNGGPDYHAVVISGYDEEKQEFITQEPGTRYGFNFRYKYDTLLNALHDFLPGYKTKEGQKIALFTDKTLDSSKETDGDKDGLLKMDELKYGTILWLLDSDGDGFKDGDEVKSGYSPTLAENKLKNGTLIKSPADPKVYLVENNTKRHIANEKVFLSHGWQWGDIKSVSNIFLEKLKTGKKLIN